MPSQSELEAHKWRGWLITSLSPPLVSLPLSSPLPLVYIPSLLHLSPPPLHPLISPPFPPVSPSPLVPPFPSCLSLPHLVSPLLPLVSTLSLLSLLSPPCLSLSRLLVSLSLSPSSFSLPLSPSCLSPFRVPSCLTGFGGLGLERVNLQFVVSVYMCSRQGETWQRAVTACWHSVV